MSNDESRPTIGEGDHRYQWDSNWAKLPDDITLGYTHGAGVDAQGLVYIFNQSNNPLLVFQPDGTFVRSLLGMTDRFHGAHGLTLIDTNESAQNQALWLTDQHSGEVALVDLAGKTIRTIDKPDHPAVREGKYAPTWVAQSPVDGAVFIADGYGSHLIFQFDKDGDLKDAWDGCTEPLGDAGKFNCPHGIWIGVRHELFGDEPVMYIADRGNRRIQVYSLDGRCLAHRSDQHTHSPCMFVQTGGDMVIPQLHAHISVFDATDQWVADLGRQERLVIDWSDPLRTQIGWPNVAPSDIKPGLCNSPHGMAADAEGNLYLCEWIETGRITRLTRTPR